MLEIKRDSEDDASETINKQDNNNIKKVKSIYCNDKEFDTDLFNSFVEEYKIVKKASNKIHRKIEEIYNTHLNFHSNKHGSFIAHLEVFIDEFENFVIVGQPYNYDIEKVKAFSRFFNNCCYEVLVKSYSYYFPCHAYRIIFKYKNVDLCNIVRCEL